MGEIIKYGKMWPENATDASIELFCFRSMGFEKGFDTGHTRGFHFERAVDLILPEKGRDGRVGYVRSRWSDRRIQSFVNPDRKFQTWWGSKSAGKSTDAAAIAFVYYLSAPDRTAMQICSTSKGALMKRIWSELVRFYQLYDPKELPMEYYRGKPAFQYKIPGTKQVSEKAGIFGRALLRGTVQEAVGEIIGLHNDYNVLIIDELQASRWAGVEAFDNLDSGLEARFLGMGNPVSRLDPLGLASKPKNGWNSVSPEYEEWPTEKGWTLYFDGLKSPGVEDPERYWYLINKKQIDTLRNDPGENTPRFWTMARGFIPPEGMIQTVFSEALILKHDLQGTVEWVEQPILLAAMDESFTCGGDRCLLQLMHLGMTTRGMIVMQFADTIIVNIEIQEGQPIEYFIAEKVRDYCLSRGIPSIHFGLDVTAQQTALAAIFEKVWGPIYRCQFGGAAVGERVSKSDPRPAKDVYYNRVTELWYGLREFAINGQIAGMGDDACREACNRLVVQKGGKICVESKDDMRARTSESPDIMDGHVILGAMAIDLMNMSPGKTTFGDQSVPVTNEVARQYDGDREDLLYTGEEAYDPNMFDENLNI